VQKIHLFPRITRAPSLNTEPILPPGVALPVNLPTPGYLKNLVLVGRVLRLARNLRFLCSFNQIAIVPRYVGNTTVQV